MILSKETMEDLLRRGYLNETGLRYYITVLKGEILDHSDRIKEITKEKGLHQRQEKW